MNDLENQLIGNPTGLEWKYTEEDTWASYTEEQPDLSGDKTLIVRAAATGIYQADTKTTTYQFTKDGTDAVQKYISIKHLSIEKASSEQSNKGDYAQNAIDGNINTLWHTVYDGSDQKKSITIKLDEPVYLSAFEYVPRQIGVNGRTRDGILYVSSNGEDWTEAASVTEWANNTQWKKITLQESVKIQYVKFVTTKNWGNGNYASAAMINLYEDETTKVTTTASKKTTERKTTYTNKPTQITIKAPGRATIKTIKKGKRKAKLKWKKVSKAKGYMIQYSTSKKFKRSQTKKKYTTKTSLTVKKLKSKKTYYFRIKAYTKGAANKKVYSKNWSKVKKYKI